MVLATIIGFFSVFLYLCYAYLKSRRKSRLPHGPKTIPIFGNTLQFRRDKAVIDMAELGRKYTDAHTIRLFSEDSVFFNSFELIREALCSPKYATVFAGRQPTFLDRYIVKGGEILGTYSKEWSALRKLVFKGLKHYGSNMADVEELVQGEIRHFLDRIQNEAGKSVDPWIYIGGYVTSVISMLITGRHLKHDDKQLQLLAGMTSNLNILVGPAPSQLMTSLPWLRHFPIGYGKVYQDILKDIAIMNDNIAKDRQRPREETERKPCFLDFMLQEQEKGHVTKDNVSSVMIDLLSGGTATSRTTLYSMFLVLTSRPDIQRRIQEEIDQVVGRSRLPCSSDKNLMPYTQAVLWETFRLYPAAPIALPRYTTRDVQIREYYIPKDTNIFYNVWLVLHDEKFWEDPYVFNPSRFLDDEGNLVPPDDEKRQRMIAFGVGERMCIGETLARLRIYLALTAILQNFTLVPDPEFSLPYVDPRTFEATSLLFAPQYRICFKPRTE